MNCDSNPSDSTVLFFVDADVEVDVDEDVNVLCIQVVPLLALPTIKTGDVIILVARHPGKSMSSRKKPMWLYIISMGTPTAKRHKTINLLVAKSTNMGEIASSYKLKNKRQKNRYNEKERESTTVHVDPHSKSTGIRSLKMFEIKNGREGQMT